MNKTIEVIRLVMTTSRSCRQIGRAFDVSKTTAARYKRLAEERNHQWADIKDLDDDAILALFNEQRGGVARYRAPDLAYVHAELQKPSVTLLILWLEYRKLSPEDACGYSQFTKLYRNHTKTNKLTMRQRHVAGENAFVDFSGRKPGYYDRALQRFVHTELFVGVLGYSNLTFAVAVPSQKLEDWIEANILMLEYFGGVPHTVVPDNLKAAVTRAGRDVRVNETYWAFAKHYSTVILPTRPHHPQDKGKVEVEVKLIQRWVLARLRNVMFFSLEALNGAISELLEEFNHRTQRQFGQSRRERFEQFERAALTSLPVDRYVYAELLGEITVGPDYHVCAKRHWYSVPHSLVGQRVSARASYEVVEFFCRGKRVAIHRRSSVEGGSSTLPEHCPVNHLKWAQHTPENMLLWAASIGAHFAEVVRHQFKEKSDRHGLKACDSLRSLAKDVGNVEIEAIAQYALEIKSPTVKSMKSIASSRVYRTSRGDLLETTMPQHENVRGPKYYADISESEGASC